MFLFTAHDDPVNSAECDRSGLAQEKRVCVD
jgi:hypothetical protein